MSIPFSRKDRSSIEPLESRIALALTTALPEAAPNPVLIHVEGADVAGEPAHFSISSLVGDADEVVLSGIADTVQPIISASGKIATFRDVDGDLVTVTITHGQFSPDDFVIAAQGLGGQLQSLRLRDGTSSFYHTDLSIDARTTPAGGDGFVNVGFLDAVYVSLHNIRIDGDLGRIQAGTIFVVLHILEEQHPSYRFDPVAVNLLRVRSLGAMGLDTQESGGKLSGIFLGDLTKLVVDTDVRGAEIATNYGRIGTVEIRGSFLGGKLNSIDDIGTIRVRGNVIGTMESPVVISAYGAPTTPTFGPDIGIGKFEVGRNVEYVRLLSGFLGDTPYNQNGSIGDVLVGGDWSASTALAGVHHGFDQFDGTIDDQTLDRSVFDLSSQIARIVIRGTVSGTATSGDSFGIVAERIGYARIGAQVLPFKAGAHTSGDFFSLGTTGPGPTGLAHDFSIGEAKG